jgi:hypothetical protein
MCEEFCQHVTAPEPCWHIAARLARYVMRTPVARGPRTSFPLLGIGPASGQWQGRADRSCRTGPGTISHTPAKDSRRAVRSGLPGWGSIRCMSGGESMGISCRRRVARRRAAGSRTAVGQ